MATRQQKSTLVQHSEDRSEPVLWNCQQTYCMISWVVTQHCRETRIQTNRMHCLTYSKIFGFLGSRFSYYKTSLKHTPEVHAVRAASKHFCLWEASKHQCPHKIQAALKSHFLDFYPHIRRRKTFIVSMLTCMRVPDLYWLKPPHILHTKWLLGNIS